MKYCGEDARVYYSHAPEAERGWWFKYTGADGEPTEDGPFDRRSDCDNALAAELEDLFVETEGTMEVNSGLA